jgi:hypothetical protein
MIPRLMVNSRYSIHNSLSGTDGLDRYGDQPFGSGYIIHNNIPFYVMYSRETDFDGYVTVVDRMGNKRVREFKRNDIIDNTPDDAIVYLPVSTIY